MALTSKGHFRIDGNEFVAKKLDTQYESLAGEDSGRTDDGILHINWVFRKIRKIEIEMPPMTAKEVSALLRLVQGQEYELTYFDVLDNNERTIKVYTSNSKSDLYSGFVLNGLYQGVSFNAIELEGEL